MSEAAQARRHVDPISTEPADPPPGPAHEPPPLAAALATALCAAMGIAGWVVGDHPARIPLFALAYLAGGARATAQATAELAGGRLSVDLLMILAAAGAATLGDWTEGTILLFLFSLSGALEAYAMYRTTRSIDALIQLRPREAALVLDGVERRVPVDDLALGDVVRVRPGERFPVDGVVEDGETWADEATLTGESEPVAKGRGAEVFTGTINGSGSVLVRMTRTQADTTLEKIVRLVREAQAEKTGEQRLVESWQGPYVAAVLVASGLVFVGAWLYHDQRLDDAFYHAMVLLVVASPCAVVIGPPAALLSAIARAARHGVLCKGGAHLQTLGAVDLVAFDKTGTITAGKPAVTEVWTPDGLAPERLLELAAAVEGRSEHHLARAVLAEAERRGVAPATGIRDFEAHTGQGVHANVDGTWVGVGREPLFARHGKAVPPAVADAAVRFLDRGQTALEVVVAREGPPTGGVIALADRPRADAPAALAALRRVGVGRIVILTGDHERVARAIAREVGADEVRAGLLPDEKVVELRRLMRQGRTVAMVGDGVNDAPALAAATVGIAMGGAGTDVALEVADVVLMRDDLRALPFAFWLGRQARNRVRQNLAFAFGMIALLVLSSFFGLPLWVGVLGHEGSTVICVLNGLRLLIDRPPAAIAHVGIAD